MRYSDLEGDIEVPLHIDGNHFSANGRPIFLHVRPQLNEEQPGLARRWATLGHISQTANFLE